MRNRLMIFSCRATSVAVVLFSAVAASGFPPMVDLNGNGISDVWEWIYGTNGVINPIADPDGDGYSNQQEAVAGTNPFNSNSVPKISFIAVTSGTNVSVSIPCALGKQYQLQSVQGLDSSSLSNWFTEATVIARTGTVVTLVATADATAKFFRIAISDVDSNGDGLNDWEKYQLGLDPLNARSNGQMDPNGQALSDYAYVTNKLASQNVITISATDPVTTQPDSGQTPTDLGMFTITRGGFPLNSITVNLALDGPGTGFAAEGVDHAVLPRSVILTNGVSSKTIALTPLADTNLMTPVIATMKLLSGTGYSIGNASNASVVIYPSPTPNGTGLIGQYFTNSSATYSNIANFNTSNQFLTRTDAVVDFVWGGTNPAPSLSNGLYTVRWTGQVQPQYSESYFFDVKSDDGVKLWVNDQLVIDKWQTQNTEWSNSIVLQGGVRYNIRLEYLQTGGSAQAHLYWYSPNQSKQIIPGNRLYPTNSFGTGSSNAPAVVTSALSAYGFVGQPFSFTVTGANTPLGYTAKGLPPGLNFNSTNGLINGTPTLAGDYQATLTASNAIGTGASVLDILIYDTNYSSFVQEIWTGVPGTNIADIPTGTPASLTNTLPTLEGITNYDDNYGERVRGFFTAPVTGNYYFWIAASDSAELWISNDSEPVNKVRRAWVTPTNNPTAAGQNGTSPRQWNLQPSQRSGWLALVAGQKYYLEILHKAGVGTNDNWAVGWLQDPTGTNTTPAGVTPNYLLSRYYPPLPVNIPGTLYTANLLAPEGVASTGVGSATLRLSADGLQAILKFQLNNLVGTPSAESIDTDPYLTFSGMKDVFDISVAHPQADGSYVWNIKSTGGLAPADIDEIIKEGKALINIGTTFVPGGEVSGHFTAANGSQIFTPPPQPPSWTDDHSDSNAAARFLIQATFGPNSNDIASVQSLGYDAWINNQFSLPATHHLPVVLANVSPDPSNPYPSSDWFNTWWQQSVTAPDQLRQRVAFALSEIMVASENGVLQDNARALSSYYDTLLDNSFGNYRALLKGVTLAPAMGLYLDMRANDVGSIITGIHANENYAREVQQLFSIGLNRLWPDGTLILNSQGNLVPTYSQNVVMGFASVFTGWNYNQTNQANGRLPSNWFPGANYTNPMVLVPTHHELGTKLLLDSVVLPPAWGNQANSAFTNFDLYCSQDLEAAMDSIFYNQNVGPFICRQLIQRLVTSNPSRDYLYRVVQKFNDNGSGVRGDMQAVIKAILLDYEARGTNFISLSTYGKQREPLVRVTATARVFPPPPALNGTYSENGDRPITITTPTPHRLNNGDTVMLSFTDTSGNPAPPSQSYSVTATGTNTFTVNAPNLLSGTYVQTNNVITVSVGSHGLAAGNVFYLGFTTGGAVSSLFSVLNVISSSQFTVATSDNAARSGNCLLPKISASGYVQAGTNVTVSCAGPHGLVINETIYIPANSVLLSPGFYLVNAIPDATHFSVLASASLNTTQSGFTLYPLGTPALTRSGNVGVQEGTWNMSYTDTGATFNLAQSPLRSPTVFNFFFPGYEFPGALASAGLTTPEFQLTSDTSVALQMNFLEGGILANGNNNTNISGLSSFNNGNGAIVLDFGPWMTTNYTAAAGVPGLVDSLNTALLAGQLSAAAKTNIVNYVTNTASFPYSTPPSSTQMRDRVRAAVHLIVSSPDFTIQK